MEETGWKGGKQGDNLFFMFNCRRKSEVFGHKNRVSRIGQEVDLRKGEGCNERLTEKRSKAQNAPHETSNTLYPGPIPGGLHRNDPVRGY